jgi:uncharacterized membrane protein
MPDRLRVPAILGIVASVAGLVFAAYSSVDYAQHLDRHLHDVHCSLIPGLASGSEDDNPCRAAMYSSYSAIFRGTYWGGIPISLFALGAFSFFLGFSVYLLVAAKEAPQKALLFFAGTAVTPFAVSLVMLAISIGKIGSLCRTCVGIYLASALLFAAAVLTYRRMREPEPPGSERVAGPWGPPILWALGLAASTLVPSFVYAASVPDQRPFLRNCGKLEKTAEAHNALLKMKTPASVRAATLFEDPLCPTCRAFHQRLVSEGVYDRLDIQLSLLPLDNDCNWMLSTPLHRGACTVSRAVICGGDKARKVLEWAYDEQETLAKAAKSSDAELRRLIQQEWGATMMSCLDSPATKLKLNQQLHFAADNAVPISTPQLYIGDRKVCDEDTDLGLKYTLAELAPEVVR